jgi:hypothetical protein
MPEKERPPLPVAGFAAPLLFQLPAAPFRSQISCAPMSTATPMVSPAANVPQLATLLF